MRKKTRFACFPQKIRDKEKFYKIYTRRESDRNLQKTSIEKKVGPR